LNITPRQLLLQDFIQRPVLDFRTALGNRHFVSAYFASSILPKKHFDATSLLPVKLAPGAFFSCGAPLP
jgi:hypothetical protein